MNNYRLKQTTAELKAFSISEKICFKYQVLYQVVLSLYFQPFFLKFDLANRIASSWLDIHPQDFENGQHLWLLSPIQVELSGEVLSP